MSTILVDGNMWDLWTCADASAPRHPQITNPNGVFEVSEKSSSNGDHSFEAKHDGKYTYCFGNEHWGSSSKEVSFNVHGIVYVSESEAAQDPLESEGMDT